MSTRDQTTFPFNLSSFTYLYNNTIRLVINLILHIIQNQTVIFKNFIFLTSIGSYWQEIELQLGHGCHVENVRRELCVQHHRSATPHSATQRLAILNAPQCIHIESCRCGCRPPVFAWREGVASPASKRGKPPGEAPIYLILIE